MKRNFMYVGNAVSNDISVFHLSEDGKAELIETVPFEGVSVAGNATPLAISPDRRFLYAGIRAAPFTVLTYAIDADTGRLRQLDRAALPDSMAYLSTDKTGRFLLSASYGGSVVAVNPISRDGVAGDPIQVLETGLNAHAIRTSPDNAYAFVTNLGADRIAAYRFDAATGMLSAGDPPAIELLPKSGPRHLIFSPDGRFVFVINEHSAQVLVFAYDAASGGWQQRGAANVLPDGFDGTSASADLKITPDGRFVYASERNSSILTLMHFDASTGSLTAKERFDTERQPRGFTIDPSGRFLAAVGELSNGLTVYAINPQNGGLTAVCSHPTGLQPNWVEIVSFE